MASLCGLCVLCGKNSCTLKKLSRISSTYEHESGSADGRHGLHGLARIHSERTPESHVLIRVYSCPFVVQKVSVRFRAPSASEWQILPTLVAPAGNSCRCLIRQQGRRFPSPGGRFENSPAVDCRVQNRNASSPEGTAESSECHSSNCLLIDVAAIQPCLRDGRPWDIEPSVETLGYFQRSLR